MHRSREDGGNNRIGGMPARENAAASVREEAECSRFDVPVPRDRAGAA